LVVAAQEHHQLRQLVLMEQIQFLAPLLLMVEVVEVQLPHPKLMVLLAVLVAAVVVAQ
jgi:hypothetical protein